jgi:hypothetical protein
MPHQPSDLYRYHALADGRQVGRFQPLDRIGGLVHAVTTRRGGLFSRQPDDDRTAYTALGDQLGFEQVAWCEQVHGCEVVPVESGGCAGRADGLVTTRAGLALLGRSADCPLILAADSAGGVAGLVHASWRGTVRNAAGQLIAAMRQHAHPENIVACIAPSACPDCYTVGAEVRDEAIARCGESARAWFIHHGPTMSFDLWAANTAQLLAAGVDPATIYVARVCTIEQTLYPSHRREGDRAGRFVGIIGRRTS